jgi:hypothetical protein
MEFVSRGQVLNAFGEKEKNEERKNEERKRSNLNLFKSFRRRRFRFA